MHTRDIVHGAAQRSDDHLERGHRIPLVVRLDWNASSRTIVLLDCACELIRKQLLKRTIYFSIDAHTRTHTLRVYRRRGGEEGDSFSSRSRASEVVYTGGFLWRNIVSRLFVIASIALNAWQEVVVGDDALTRFQPRLKSSSQYLLKPCAIATYKGCEVLIAARNDSQP